MSETPITREALHKALQEPTARELLQQIDSNAAKYVLASRVDSVLAIEPRRWAGWDCCLAEVLRLLNGEER